MSAQSSHPRAQTMGRLRQRKDADLVLRDTLALETPEGWAAPCNAGGLMWIALFVYGFRPFFLAAGIAATVLVPWWAASLAWGIPLGTTWPAALWHGHEMLFGFIVAAIAGFLLTAVPSWTGARGFAGSPLVHEKHRLWLIVDQAGRILQRSTVRRSRRQGVQRRSGSGP